MSELGKCVVCGLPTYWKFKDEYICYPCEKTRSDKNNEKIKLKRCSICKEEMRISERYILHKEYTGCFLSTYGIPITDVLMWNNRPIEDELKKENEELKKELKELKSNTPIAVEMGNINDLPTWCEASTSCKGCPNTACVDLDKLNKSSIELVTGEKQV